MRKYKIEKDGWKVNVEEFESFNELLKVCDEREVNDWVDRGDDARTATDDSWRGGSYKKSRDLLVHGWDEKLEEIKEKCEKYSKEVDVQRPRQFTSRVGYSPNVPNALRGLPNSMFNLKLEPKKSKVLDICVDFGIRSGEDVDAVIRKSVKLLAKINSLEQSGYRVKLSFLKTFNDEGDLSYVCKMTLKNEFQPLDLKRVAFPMGHPAMFRRMMFDWYERFPNAEHISGYGISLGILYRDHRSYYEKLEKMLCKKNQYMINYYTDLDEMFKGLK